MRDCVAAAKGHGAGEGQGAEVLAAAAAPRRALAGAWAAWRAGDVAAQAAAVRDREKGTASESYSKNIKNKKREIY